jgi:hypothetical protein
MCDPGQSSRDQASRHSRLTRTIGWLCPCPDLSSTVQSQCISPGRTPLRLSKGSATNKQRRKHGPKPTHKREHFHRSSTHTNEWPSCFRSIALLPQIASNLLILLRKPNRGHSGGCHWAWSVEFRFSTEIPVSLLANLTFYLLWNCGKGRPFFAWKTGKCGESVPENWSSAFPRRTLRFAA